ncbi:fumarylacetoacetate hydrolase [Aspergillus heteromorphus CBS 117.55]|uniref:Fumarylacetoacetase n=1 Tax=Aspergillus heteromorphus CBS 117.55 TaxID=1448321 RepID=A0A317X3E1_9EURO|nr:fumarylacetoacetate hydrolase [Aspergillus heteromorphus CBS 117.55]PWY92142.1 fumarylacetoacetate hydrolase [Aspergillus heteromorphus CBS 117.55]
MTSPEYAHHFTIQNLPYGIASSPTHPTPQCATRLHNTIIFLADLHDAGLFSSIPALPANVFTNPTLNSFAALPQQTHSQIRHVLKSTLQQTGPPLALALPLPLPSTSMADISTVTMHLPVSIPSFTDFSASLPHNQNAGRIILGHDSLPPAFFHFPIGYAGRASMIAISGTPITRPVGHICIWEGTSAPEQTKKKKKEKNVIFAPCQSLDYELELGVIIGKPLARGTGLNAVDAEEHIFGLVVLNDWSARDIQSLEMIPLGPLNGKSFATTISPWIIPLSALAPFKTTGPEPRVSLPPHLQDPGAFNYDITVMAELEGEGLAGRTVMGRSNAKELFWSIRQMAAHLASTGCDLRTGEVLGTGTVSGEVEGSFGSLLEVTRGGRVGIGCVGRERGYLVDGDVVRLSAWAGEGVGFGECVGVVRAAALPN